MKDVLAYLRKSRDENKIGAQELLSKHRQMLLDMCAREGYSPTFYEEVGSSERILGRPRFQELLAELENNDYFAVIAVDTDRLSRGDILSNSDVVTIYSTLTRTNTLLHTVRDGILNPAEDKIYLGIKSLFANMEYDTIKKRLKDGKKEGTKQGKWTNGKPPYPYVYNKVDKTVRVNESNLPHYRFLIESYLAGNSIPKIASALNSKRIPSPGGSYWNSGNVHRLLRDEFHLGVLVTNKSVGSAHKKKGAPLKKIPQHKWARTDGNHEAIKTEAEHRKILALLSQNSLIPNRAKSGTYALSGILYCGKCGRRMQLFMRKSGKRRVVSARCIYKEWGHVPPKRCPQRGFTLTESFMDKLYRQIEYEHLQLVTKKMSDTRTSTNEEELARLKDDKKKHLSAIERIQSQYEDGLIDKSMWLERTSMRKGQMEIVQARINDLEDVAEVSQPISVEDLTEKVNEFKKVGKSIYTQEEYNLLLRRIVKRLVYDYCDGNATIQIEMR